MEPSPPVLAPLPSIFPAQAPPPQQPVVAVATAPTNYYNWGLYLALGFIFLLLTYVAVAYTRDVRTRDQRSQRFNVMGYVDYALKLARRHPHGHTTKTWQVTDEVPGETLFHSKGTE